MVEMSEQQALFIEGNGSDRLPALHSEQWRLAGVEVVNWGTFSGYQILPVDRRGLLITGPSGSGKSSLLDAITTVLTPPTNRRLNAAALSGSSKGEDRTVCSYVRGAWRHETDETGEVANSYLRPNRATWSGIMLRYESGYPDKDVEGRRDQKYEPINLLALFNLKAGSNSQEGLSTLYAVVRGDHSLKEFEPYAVNGIDIGKFKRDYKEVAQAYREHSSFAHHFCRLMGISSSKTLVLLHKTQAAKNFGSLDDLFRRFMLEEPETFKQADIAVEQFSALDQAYEGVVDQRKQMQHLEPLIDLDSENQKAHESIIRLQHLDQVLNGYTEQLIIEHLETEREKQQRRADQLVETVLNVAKEQKLAQSAFNQAQANMNDAGGLALDAAASELLNYEQHFNYVRQNRENLASELAFVGIHEVPQSYSDWKSLAYTISEQADKAEGQQVVDKEANYVAYGQVGEIKKQQSNLAKELRHLRSRSTNIPLKFHEVRVGIATHLGISVDELPFVGELVSVKPECGAWRGAIERLLGQYAKTLLVANRHVKAVSNYLEDTYLGLRLEYEAVPVEVEVPARTLPQNSLIKKLNVRQRKQQGEFSTWINKDLRERFNYICVGSTAELREHNFALTIGGQIKRKSRYIKDDRHRIDDQNRWILGDNNDEKIEWLIQEEQRLSSEFKKANSAAEAITRQAQVTQSLVRIRTLLNSAVWENYDEGAAQDNLTAIQNHYEQLKQSNKELSQAEAVRDEAQLRKNAADKALEEAKVEESLTRTSLEKLREEIQNHAARLAEAATPLPEDQQQLSKQFKRADSTFKKSTDAIYRASMKVSSNINEQNKAAHERVQKTQAASERIIHDFKLSWPLVAADLSEEFGDKDAYLGIYRRIKANGLPDYEQRFMQVLHDFSQDQITVLTSTIRGAFREVKEKLIPVNKSLGLSEYSRGIHLQIEAKDNRSKQVADFLSELQVITQDTWSENDLESAENRYIRTARVIERFRSTEYADKKWKNECLDTRQHVGFIAKEIDNEGNVQGVHSSDAGLSGGQKQKLVIFCLAAALRYQLADEDQPVPSYGTVILDEAFDKADHQFATTAMNIFEVFGFHMVLATPLKLLQTLEEHIGAIASVQCEESKHSSFQMVSIEEGNDAYRNGRSGEEETEDVGR